MSPETVKRIEAILGDGGLGKEAKIEKLRELEADAMAKHRASSEGMTPPSSHDDDDLKAIEKALTKLGEDAVDTGAASL